MTKKSMNAAGLSSYIDSWSEGNIGYFKVGRIFLNITTNAADLEKGAKSCAADIQAEVMYAWDLQQPKSDAWWLGWGGYDLEEEIPYHAVLSRKDVEEKCTNFDPDNNDFDCKSLDEFREMMVNAYDEELNAEDLTRGFVEWTNSLPEDAQKTFLADLRSWTYNARKKYA